MGMIRPAAMLLALAAALPAQAEETLASREARWHDVAAAAFHGRPVTDGAAILQLDAPDRALDAALVPISITASPAAHVVALTLVVDDNPAPVAAIVHFGPLADPHLLKLRIRVDQYTLLHAVAELQDGRLVAVSRYVKAAGGCSAPGTTEDADAATRIGRMKLRQVAGAPGQPVQASLLISHPNANGMQMDPVTRFYTPARYVQTIRVTQGGQSVFTLDGDISLSQDPAIGFAYRPVASAPLDVSVEDSRHTLFHSSFPPGTGAS